MGRANDGLPSVVYHLAEKANWQSIQRGGLLSTSRLLDATGLRGQERELLESSCRDTHCVLRSGVEIRDQRPMPAPALARALVGMTPREWYRLINARVFFWLDVSRLNRQRAACAARPQVVLVIDTSQLIERHGGRIALSPINSGNARRRAARRGRTTFVPYRAWVESRWASESAELGTPPRPRSHAPAELTVLDAVPDVMSMIVRVVHLRAFQQLGVSAGTRRLKPRDRPAASQRS